jgi:hypothetical protein
MKNKGSKVKDKTPLFCFIYLGQPDLDIEKQIYKLASYGDITWPKAYSIAWDL